MEISHLAQIIIPETYLWKAIIHQATFLMLYMVMVCQQRGSILLIEEDGNHSDLWDKETALLE